MRLERARRSPSSRCEEDLLRSRWQICGKLHATFQFVTFSFYRHACSLLPARGSFPCVGVTRSSRGRTFVFHGRHIINNAFRVQTVVTAEGSQDGQDTQ